MNIQFSRYSAARAAVHRLSVIFMSESDVLLAASPQSEKKLPTAYRCLYENRRNGTGIVRDVLGSTRPRRTGTPDSISAVLKYKIQMKESDNSNGGTAREMENLCRPLSRRIEYVRELSAPLKPIRGTNPSTYQPRILEKRERFSQISCFKKEKSAICTNSSIHFRA